jgi:hypothetical protein
MTTTLTANRTARIAHQIGELTTRRAELHAEMVSSLTGNVDSQWFADRANEMDHTNRQLSRLQAELGSLIGVDD